MSGAHDEIAPHRSELDLESDATFMSVEKCVAVLQCRSNDPDRIILLLPNICAQHCEDEDSSVVIEVFSFLNRVGEKVQLCRDLSVTLFRLLHRHGQDENVALMGWAAMRSLAAKASNATSLAMSDLVLPNLVAFMKRLAEKPSIIEQIFAFICNVTHASQEFKHILLLGNSLISSNFCETFAKTLDQNVRAKYANVVKQGCSVVRNVSNLELEPAKISIIGGVLVNSGICKSLASILQTFPQDDLIFNEACCAVRNLLTIESVDVEQALKDEKIGVSLFDYVAKMHDEETCRKDLLYQAFCTIYSLGTVVGLLESLLTTSVFEAVIRVTRILATDATKNPPSKYLLDVPDPITVAFQFVQMIRNFTVTRNGLVYEVKIRQTLLKSGVAAYIMELTNRFLRSSSPMATDLIEQACVLIRILCQDCNEFVLVFCKLGLADYFQAASSIHKSNASTIEQILSCIIDLVLDESAAVLLSSNSNLVSSLVSICSVHVSNPDLALLACLMLQNWACWGRSRPNVLKGGAMGYATSVLRLYEAEERVSTLAVNALRNLIVQPERRGVGTGTDASLSDDVNDYSKEEEARDDRDLADLCDCIEGIIGWDAEVYNPSKGQLAMVSKCLMVMTCLTSGTMKAKLPSFRTVILSVIARAAECPENSECAELAALFIRNMAIGNETAKGYMSMGGALEYIVDILRRHPSKPAVVVQCVSVIRIYTATKSLENSEYCAKLVECGLCDVIWETLRAIKDDAAACRMTFGAICTLAMHGAFVQKCDFNTSSRAVMVDAMKLGLELAIASNLVERDLLMYGLLAVRNLTSQSSSAKLGLGHANLCSVLIDTCQFYQMADPEVVVQCLHCFRNLVLETRNQITLYDLDLCALIIDLYDSHAAVYNVLEELCAVVSNLTSHQPSKDYLIRCGLCERVTSVFSKNISNPAVVEHCIWVIRNLSSANEDACSRFGVEGCCEIVASALREHMKVPLCVLQLCQVVRNLALCSADNNKRFGACCMIDLMHEVIREHFASEEIWSNCLYAVWNLAIDDTNREAFGASGICFPIAALILTAASDSVISVWSESKSESAIAEESLISLIEDTRRRNIRRRIIRGVYNALVDHNDGNKIKFYDCICRIKALSVLDYGDDEVKGACAFEIDHLYEFMRLPDDRLPEMDFYVHGVDDQDIG